MLNRDGSFRFLGFAFASADLLFEIDPAGRIGFAVGAGKRVLGRPDAELIGRDFQDVFDPEDRGLVAALLDSLGGVARKGPVRVRLKHALKDEVRAANLYACRLPQLGGSVSCAVSLAREGPTPAEGGLLDREAFDEVVGKLLSEAKEAGLDVELALVEVAGLTDALRDLSAPEAEKTVSGLSNVLKAEALRGAATRLEDERFAIVRERPEGPDTLANRLRRAVSSAGADLAPETAVVKLEEVGSSQGLRALRFTLDQFLKDGLQPDRDVAATFKEGLDGTLRLAKEFTEGVKARKFKLVYQPIVDLRTGIVHHHEALARFPDGEGTFETIRMAEELDIIEAFDLAVAETAVAALAKLPAGVRIAVNVSGRSFLRPRFLDRLLALCPDARIRPRLLYEITESSALANLDLADERIQRLRREGHEVCIDDFGAGAASLSYLRSLTVDAVKIDGQFVREIARGGREAVFIRHLAAMCRELKVHTIAEFVETPQVADTLREYGVDLAQGYLFGAPEERIATPQPEPKNAVRPALRRAGVRETWG